MSVAKMLKEKGAQVLAIDTDEKKVQEIMSLVDQAIVGDATDEKVLKSIGISDFDTAIVAIGQDMQASTLVTLLLREFGIKNIVVKSINSLHAKLLAKIGADKIVYPELEAAKRLAESLISPSIIEEIELSPEYNIVEIISPQKFLGNTIRQLAIRTEYNVNVIAIRRKVPYLTETGESNFKEEVIISPNPDEELIEGDILVLLGKDKNIERMKHL